MKAGAFLFAGVLFLATGCGGAAEKADPTTVNVMNTVTFDYQGHSAAATVVEVVDNFSTDKDLTVLEGNKLIAVHVTMTKLSKDVDEFTFNTAGFQLSDKAGKKYEIDPIMSLKMSDAYDGELGLNPKDGMLYFQVPAATELATCKLELSDGGKGSLGSIALVEGKVKEATRKSSAVLTYDNFGRIVEIKCTEITEFLPTKDEFTAAKGLSLLRVKVSMTNTTSEDLTVFDTFITLGSKFYTSNSRSNASDAPQMGSVKVPAGKTVDAVLYYDLLPGDSDFKLISYEDEVKL